MSTHQFVAAPTNRSGALERAYGVVEIGPWAEAFIERGNQLAPGAFKFNDPSDWTISVINRGEVQHIESRTNLAGQLIVKNELLPAHINDGLPVFPSRVGSREIRQRGATPNKKELFIALKNDGSLESRRTAIIKSIEASTYKPDGTPLPWLNKTYAPRIRVGFIVGSELERGVLDKMRKRIPSTLKVSKVVIETVGDEN